MDDTGRIRRPLTPTARRIVFGPPAPGPSELLHVTWVDRAHLVMPAEQGILHRAAAAALLVEIEHLRAVGFAPLEGAEARRGRYLLYEDWLAARLGDRTAGILRTGRSRNDAPSPLVPTIASLSNSSPNVFTGASDRSTHK